MSTERISVLSGFTGLLPELNSQKLVDKFSLHCKQVLCTSLSSIELSNKQNISLDFQTDLDLVSDNILLVQHYNSKQMRTLVKANPFWNTQELMTSVFNTLMPTKAKNLYILFWDINGVDVGDTEEDAYITPIASAIPTQVLQKLPQVVNTQVGLYFKKPLTKSVLLEVLEWFAAFIPKKRVHFQTNILRPPKHNAFLHLNVCSLLLLWHIFSYFY